MENLLPRSSAPVKPSPCDADFCFLIQVYKDYQLANAFLARVRKFYPTSRVIVISDGDPDPRYQRFASRYRVEYTQGERLYGVEKGGQLIHRMLEHFMAQPAPFLIKMDTDTRIDRRFEKLPEGDFIFGTRQTEDGCLQGGCVLMPLDVCKKMYEARVFLSDELKDWRTSWGRMGNADNITRALAYRAEHMKMIGFDWVLQWACQKLGIETRDFTEVSSRWEFAESNPRLKFAVVHPDKFLYLPGPMRLFKFWYARARRRLQLP